MKVTADGLNAWAGGLDGVRASWIQPAQPQLLAPLREWNQWMEDLCLSVSLSLYHCTGQTNLFFFLSHLLSAGSLHKCPEVKSGQNWESGTGLLHWWKELRYPSHCVLLPRRIGRELSMLCRVWHRSPKHLGHLLQNPLSSYPPLPLPPLPSSSLSGFLYIFGWVALAPA